VIERTIDETRAVEDPVTDLCTCGHLPKHHDARASRYCQATVSNELLRRCICVEPTAKSAGRR
jgi:hypothetical protein